MIVKLSKRKICLCFMINIQLRTTKNMKPSGHGDYVSGNVAKNRWQIVSALCFLVVKRVLNRTWNWLKVFICEKVFTKMVLDSRLHSMNCVTRGMWNMYNIITEEKARTLFCEGPMSCWRGIRVRKLSSNVTVQIFTMSVNSLK